MMIFKKEYAKSNDKIQLTEKEKEEMIERLKHQLHGTIETSYIEKPDTEQGQSRKEADIIRVILPVDKRSKKGIIKKVIGTAATAAIIVIGIFVWTAAGTGNNQTASDGMQESRVPDEVINGMREESCNEERSSKDNINLEVQQDNPEDFLSLFLPADAEDNIQYSITNQVLMQYLADKLQNDVVEKVRFDAGADPEGTLDFVRNRHLLYGTYYDTLGMEKNFCVIVLNLSRESYCLIYKEDAAWDLVDMIQCGEISNDSDIGIESIQTGENSMVKLLRLNGWLDSGTGMSIYETIYYNLNSLAPALIYISRNYNTEMTGLSYYNVECEIDKSYIDNIQRWTLTYHCNFYETTEAERASGEYQPVLSVDIPVVFVWDQEAGGRFAMYENAYNFKWAGYSKSYVVSYNSITMDVMRPEWTSRDIYQMTESYINAILSGSYDHSEQQLSWAESIKTKAEAENMLAGQEEIGYHAAKEAEYWK